MKLYPYYIHLESTFVVDELWHHFFFRYFCTIGIAIVCPNYKKALYDEKDKKPIHHGIIPVFSFHTRPHGPDEFGIGCHQ